LKLWRQEWQAAKAAGQHGRIAEVLERDAVSSAPAAAEESGDPMSASTQWEMVKEAAEAIEPAWEELIRQAAQGEVPHNDDTTAVILHTIRERRKREQAQEGGEAHGPQESTGTFAAGRGDARRRGCRSGRRRICACGPSGWGLGTQHDLSPDGKNTWSPRSRCGERRRRPGAGLRADASLSGGAHGARGENHCDFGK